MAALPSGVAVFDHIGFNVADFQKSKRFYLAALAPLGHELLAEGDGWAMIGNESGRIWIGSWTRNKPIPCRCRRQHSRSRESFLSGCDQRRRTRQWRSRNPGELLAHLLRSLRSRP